MITAVSPATAKAVMDVLLQRCLWASLHHDVPDFSSSAASELQFGGYGRQQVEWERSPGGWYASNLLPLQWHGLVFPSKVVAVGLWDQQFGGSLHASGVLNEVSRVTGSAWSLEATMQVIRIGTGMG